MANIVTNKDYWDFLEAENKKLKNQLKEIKVLKESFEAENKELKNVIDKQTVTIHEVDEENKDLNDVINYLRNENSNLYDRILELKDNSKQLHTIKKSFEVLRALYLGDYEDDEPF